LTYRINVVQQIFFQNIAFTCIVDTHDLLHAFAILTHLVIVDGDKHRDSKND